MLYRPFLLLVLWSGYIIFLPFCVTLQWYFIWVKKTYKNQQTVWKVFWLKLYVAMYDIHLILFHLVVFAMILYLLCTIQKPLKSSNFIYKTNYNHMWSRLHSKIVIDFHFIAYYNSYVRTSSPIFQRKNIFNVCQPHV